MVLALLDWDIHVHRPITIAIGFLSYSDDLFLSDLERIDTPSSLLQGYLIHHLISHAPPPLLYGIH